jgi:hypothetical protein
MVSPSPPAGAVTRDGMVRAFSSLTHSPFGGGTMEATNRRQADKTGNNSEGKTGRAGRPSKARAGGSRIQADTSRAGIVRLVRSLPKTIGVQMRAHPPETVAAVGAVSFALGAVLGSRLGRLMLAVAIPLAIKSAFEGEVARELGKYAQGFIRNVQSPRQTDA